jgi:hypothetical protein
MTPLAWVYMTDTVTTNYMLGGCSCIEQMLGGLRMFTETETYDKMEMRFERGSQGEAAGCRR